MRYIIVCLVFPRTRLIPWWIKFPRVPQPLNVVWSRVTWRGKTSGTTLYYMGLSRRKRTVTSIVVRHCVVQYFIHDLSIVCLCVRSFVRSFVSSFLRSYVRSFVRSFACSFVRSFVRLFVCSFVRSFLCSFLRSFVLCTFIHSFVRSFTSSFLRSFVCLFVLSFVLFARSLVFSLVHSFTHFFVYSFDLTLALSLFRLFISPILCRVYLTGLLLLLLL